MESAKKESPFKSQFHMSSCERFAYLLVNSVNMRFSWLLLSLVFPLCGAITAERFGSSTCSSGTRLDTTSIPDGTCVSLGSVSYRYGSECSNQSWLIAVIVLASFIGLEHIIGVIYWLYFYQRTSVPVRPTNENTKPSTVQEGEEEDEEGDEEEEREPEPEKKNIPQENTMKKPPVTFAKNAQGQWARVIV